MLVRVTTTHPAHLVHVEPAAFLGRIIFEVPLNGHMLGGAGPVPQIQNATDGYRAFEIIGEYLRAAPRYVDTAQDPYWIFTYTSQPGGGGPIGKLRIYRHSWAPPLRWELALEHPGNGLAQQLQLMVADFDPDEEVSGPKRYERAEVV